MLTSPSTAATGASWCATLEANPRAGRRRSGRSVLLSDADVRHFGLKDKIRHRLGYGASYWLLQLAENLEQRLARVAESVVHLPAAAMRLDQVCSLQSREVG